MTQLTACLCLSIMILKITCFATITTTWPWPAKEEPSSQESYTGFSFFYNLEWCIVVSARDCRRLKYFVLLHSENWAVSCMFTVQLPQLPLLESPRDCDGWPVFACGCANILQGINWSNRSSRNANVCPSVRAAQFGQDYSVFIIMAQIFLQVVFKHTSSNL